MRNIITVCLAAALWHAPRKMSNFTTTTNEHGKDVSDFLNNFAGHQLPDHLEKLYAFDGKSREEYARGFELVDLSQKLLLKSYSDDSLFLASFIGFAQASHSDSHYALWIANNRDLNAAPIVVFGAEGGYHVVADDMMQLLLILSCDVEPLVRWEGVIYGKRSPDEASPRNGEFRDWLKKTFGIRPVVEADSIVKIAGAKHGEKFRNWIRDYLK